MIFNPEALYLRGNRIILKEKETGKGDRLLFKER
jgi:hypothetical protein